MTTSIIPSPPPQVVLNPLPQSDGSCQFKQGLTRIICSVNGPIEVQARDELPKEATVKVVLKPGIGVGGTREKYLEQTLEKALRSLILVEHHPRTLIQIVVQIVEADDHTSIPILLSPLLNCSFLALLAAAIPLRTTFFSTHLGVLSTSEIIQNPDRDQLARCKSSHTLGFTKEGGLIFIDSRDSRSSSGGGQENGGWQWDEWVRITEEGKKLCCGEGIDVIRDLFALDA